MLLAETHRITGQHTSVLIGRTYSMGETVLRVSIHNAHWKRDSFDYHDFALQMGTILGTFAPKE